MEYTYCLFYQSPPDFWKSNSSENCSSFYYNHAVLWATLLPWKCWVLHSWTTKPRCSTWVVYLFLGEREVVCMRQPYPMMELRCKTRELCVIIFPATWRKPNSVQELGREKRQQMRERKETWWEILWLMGHNLSLSGGLVFTLPFDFVRSLINFSILI